ncbi:MAG: c-type cytochrome [bacterium]|nr:c-type cytochrome [bacterium]
MKSFFKVLGLIVLGVVLVIAGFVGFIAMSGLPEYPDKLKKVDLKVEVTPARVAKGRKIATMLCNQCHFDPATKKLSGNELKELPAEFGTAFSKNITQHPTKGIGGWTDGEIAFILRTGVHPKTGLYVPPWMPKFLHMADEDLKSVIAFLRSDDPLVAPSDAENRESSPTLLAKGLARFMFKPYDYPSAPIPLPDTSNPVSFGKYIAFNYDCFTCHSGDFKEMDVQTPEKSLDFFGGGNRMGDINGKLVTTPNLTPDEATGIGKWTQDQFMRTMRTGVKPDGSVFMFPMVRATYLTDLELRSLYAYLRTVPTINKAEVANDTYADAANGSRGRQLYYKYECVRCHSTTDSGVVSVLGANEKYPEDSTLVDVILNNHVYFPDSFMPMFNGHVSTDDAMQLAAYVRELGKKKGS